MIESQFTTDEGFTAVIIRQSRGYRCGYVGIPKAHVCANHHYDDLPIDVHGGLTYANGYSEYPTKNNNLYWYGFDAGHYGDGSEIEPDFPVRSLDYMEDNCRSLSKQLAELPTKNPELLI